jgi:hypothetical protein
MTGRDILGELDVLAEHLERAYRRIDALEAEVAVLRRDAAPLSATDALEAVSGRPIMPAMLPATARARRRIAAVGDLRDAV